MLWYKSWLETRWRFLIGLGILMMLATGMTINYPAIQSLMPMSDAIDTSGPLGQLIKDAIDTQREFRGFVWYQWVRQNLAQTWTLFAVLLGSGGLLAHASGGAPLFTMSLPVSRNQVLWVRAATGLAELLVLAIIPFLLIPLLSPLIGESYRLADAVIHGACLFLAGTVFFSFALFLSTVFADLWRPLLIACAVAFVLAVVEQLPGGFSNYGIFNVMSAEAYFRSGAVPWTGMLTSLTVSAAILYGASTNFARQDF
jgi:ABC-type transport system involved in multi-copper enzyme maturation permease subunit